MTDPTFRAEGRPELHPAAQELVKVYDDTYGSNSPGCCPEALAAVLDHIYVSDKHWNAMEHNRFAALLRGEQP
jgi:hypothetical protein